MPVVERTKVYFHLHCSTRHPIQVHHSGVKDCKYNVRISAVHRQTVSGIIFKIFYRLWYIISLYSMQAFFSIFTRLAVQWSSPRVDLGFFERGPKGEMFGSGLMFNLRYCRGKGGSAGGRGGSHDP